MIFFKRRSTDQWRVYLATSVFCVIFLYLAYMNQMFLQWCEKLYQKVIEFLVRKYCVCVFLLYTKYKENYIYFRGETNLKMAKCQYLKITKHLKLLPKTFYKLKDYLRVIAEKYMCEYSSTCALFDVVFKNIFAVNSITS